MAKNPLNHEQTKAFRLMVYFQSLEMGMSDLDIARSRLVFSLTKRGTEAYYRAVDFVETRRAIKELERLLDA